jgi:hypothetical protein
MIEKLATDALFDDGGGCEHKIKRGEYYYVDEYGEKHCANCYAHMSYENSRKANSVLMELLFWVGKSLVRSALVALSLCAFLKILDFVFIIFLGILDK